MLTYKEHYELSVKNYGLQNVNLQDLYDFTVLEVKAKEQNDFIIFNDQYFKCIKKLSNLSNLTFSNPDQNCWFPPDVDRKKDKILRSKNVWLPEVNELASLIVPQIEKKLFKSFSIVDGIYWYRTFYKNTKDQNSFIWHYDNHCLERIKVMFYLNDVDKNSGPFTYMWSEKEKKGLPCPTSRIDYKKWVKKESRYSDEFIEKHKPDGYEAKQFLGNAGSFVIFDNNIMHRATNTKPNYHRDAIVFMMRPYHKKMPHFIGKNWTGSNMHIDNNKNPEFYGAIKK